MNMVLITGGARFSGFRIVMWLERMGCRKTKSGRSVGSLAEDSMGYMAFVDKSVRMCMSL